MSYEVDLLAVGEGERSGDAITFRFGNLFGSRNEQTVVIIDGGFQADGTQLVNHIRHHYNTNQIDLVISTHPDQDHAAGLVVVLEHCEVRTLWMHRPWLHAPEIASAFDQGAVTAASVFRRLRENLELARRLESIAVSKGIPIVEPFAGASAWNRVLVLGPTLDYYRTLLTDFRDTPTTSPTFERMAELLFGMPKPSGRALVRAR